MSGGAPGTWESNGLRLSYRAWGEPDRPLLIVHHGFLDHSGSWAPVAERLAERWRVLAVDARGHGDSEWIGAGGAYYFSDYVLDLRSLLEDELGDPRVALMGHSMGASVASYYAGAFPERVRGIVMVDSLGPPHEDPTLAPAILRRFVETTRRQSARREPVPMASVEEAALRMRKADRLLGEEQALALAQGATRAIRDGVVWKFDPLHRARIGTPFNREWALGLWAAVPQPVLHVRGARSPFRLPDHEQRCAAFADFREEVVENAGHNVHAHAPEVLAGLAAEFLAGLPA